MSPTGSYSPAILLILHHHMLTAISDNRTALAINVTNLNIIKSTLERAQKHNTPHCLNSQLQAPSIIVRYNNHVLHLDTTWRHLQSDYDQIMEYLAQSKDIAGAAYDIAYDAPPPVITSENKTVATPTIFQRIVNILRNRIK